jgi:hypothetical protein
MQLPNYEILQNARAQKQKTNPILQEIVNGFEAYNKAVINKEQSALRQAEMEISKTKLQGAKLELEQAPELHKMKQETHQATLGQMAASTEATRASTAATRQGMGTETLRQQAMRNEIAMKTHESLNLLAAGVKNAPPERQQEALNMAISRAETAGLPWPKDIPTDINNPKTQLFIDSVYNSSGQALKDLKMEREKANVNKLNGAGNINPIAAELPKVQAKQYVKLTEDTAQSAQGANDLRSKLDAFEASMKQVPGGTGPQWGAWGATKLSPQAQNLQQLTEDLTIDQTKFAKGALSDKDIEMYRNSTAKLTNSPEANKKIIDRKRAAAERVESKPVFIQAMTEAGVYDPTKIEATWSKFVNSKRLYDPKTGEPIKDNIAGWQAFVPEQEGINTPTAANTRTSSISGGQIVTGKDGRQYRKVNGGYEAI